MRVRGRWSPNSNDWRKNLALCLLFDLLVENVLVQVSKRLLLLKKLDGYPIIREDDDHGEEEVKGEGDSDSSDYEELNH